MMVELDWQMQPQNRAIRNRLNRLVYHLAIDLTSRARLVISQLLNDHCRLVEAFLNRVLFMFKSLAVALVCPNVVTSINNTVSVFSLLFTHFLSGTGIFFVYLYPTTNNSS